MIGDGKLAARLRGSDDRNSCSDRECPICFLSYAEINVTKCCNASICTECYLQVKPQRQQAKPNGKPQLNHCPFCNASRLNVTVAGKLDSCAVEQRFNEEQQMEADRIRSRNGMSGGLGAKPEQPEANPNGLAATPSSPTPKSGFGSSLEQNDRVALMRARSNSAASEHSASHHPSSSAASADMSHLAMTPEDRQSLEDEMRAQHHHPLAVRLEREETERRTRNEMEYYQRAQTARRNIRDVRGGALSPPSPHLSPSGRPLPARPNPLRLGGSPPVAPASARDWSSPLAARYFNSRAEDDNERAVLEAALLLSLEEQGPHRAEGAGPPTRHGGGGGRPPEGPAVGAAAAAPLGARSGSSSPSPRDAAAGLSTVLGLTEDQQVALAIAASLREPGASPAEADHGV